MTQTEHYTPLSGLSITGDALLSLSLLSLGMKENHPGVSALTYELEGGRPCPPELARALNDLARLALEAGPLLKLSGADSLIRQGLSDPAPLRDLTPWLLNLAALGDGADHTPESPKWHTSAPKNASLPSRLCPGHHRNEDHSAARAWREVTGLQRPPADPMRGTPRPAPQLYAQVALARAGELLPAEASPGESHPIRLNLLSLARALRLGHDAQQRQTALITLRALAEGQ